MATDTLKRLICEFDKPTNVSQLVTYYLNFLNGMAADPLFDDIAQLIEAAELEVTKLDDAELTSKTRAPGTVALRDKQLLATNIKLDQVLSRVQEAGDANLKNARVVFERHQLKIVVHPGHTRDDIEVKHGKVSKTFIVRNKPVAQYAAYIWLISIDKINWKLGTFSSKSSGFISKCGDDDLVPGQRYYIKSQSTVKGIFSNWSQIIEIICT